MQPASMSRSNSIGVMATRHLDDWNCIEFLTPNERARWQAIRNNDRRRGWLGGRLVAKYHFLAALGDERTDGPPWRPQLRVVDKAQLEDYPPWAYREIEILPPPYAQARVSQLSWMGRRQPVHVSLSHTSGTASACLNGSAAIGLDIEFSGPRGSSFYRGNFSPWERRWVEGFRNSAAVDVDRAYTLLWCLKEAALKSRQSAEDTILQIPQIEVRPLCSAGALLAVLHCRQLGAVLLVAQVEIRQAGRIASAEAAITSDEGAILVALWVQEGR